MRTTQGMTKRKLNTKTEEKRERTQKNQASRVFGSRPPDCSRLTSSEMKRDLVSAFPTVLGGSAHSHSARTHTVANRHRHANVCQGFESGFFSRVVAGGLH